MRLIADIGGTNSRLALSDQGQLRPGSTRRFRNADFASFDAVVRAYLDDIGGATPDEIALAVAGPVDRDTARLTNRGWEISVPRLCDRLGAGQGRIINDLVALGYSVPGLGKDDLHTVAEGTPEAGTPRQSLVVGIGTGFNVSPIVEHGGHTVCLRAESGHIGLPAGIARAMEERHSRLARNFPTVEHCFSGRGFADLCRLMTGRTGTGPEEFMRLGEEGEPEAAEAIGFYAELIGWLHRELMLAYLPTAGVYFAGSVARSTLSPTWRARFQDICARPYNVRTHAAAPVYTIVADAAALHGCARMPVADA